MWRPKEWKNPWKGINLLSSDKKTQYLLDNIFEQGANSILREFINFLKKQYPGVIFELKGSMTKEEWIKMIH